MTRFLLAAVAGFFLAGNAVQATPDASTCVYSKGSAIENFLTLTPPSTAPTQSSTVNCIAKLANSTTGAIPGAPTAEAIIGAGTQSAILSVLGTVVAYEFATALDTFFATAGVPSCVDSAIQTVLTDSTSTLGQLVPTCADLGIFCGNSGWTTACEGFAYGDKLVKTQLDSATVGNYFIQNLSTIFPDVVLTQYVNATLLYTSECFPNQCQAAVIDACNGVISTGSLPSNLPSGLTASGSNAASFLGAATTIIGAGVTSADAIAKYLNDVPSNADALIAYGIVSKVLAGAGATGSLLNCTPLSNVACFGSLLGQCTGGSAASTATVGATGALAAALAAAAQF